MYHVVRMAYGILTISFIDIMLFVYNKHMNTTARWFLIHSFVNFIIAFISLPGVATFLQDPLSAMIPQNNTDDIFTPDSKWPITLVVCLHLYHCCGMFKLTTQDILHHTVFVPTLGIPGMIYEWGCLSNWLVFFICGIPGGIDYLILGLQKNEKMGGVNQKQICANLNMWIRLPGILFAIGIAYVIYKENKYEVPFLPFLIQVLFMPINVLYYAKQSVINYTLHEAKIHVPTQNWQELKKINI